MVHIASTSMDAGTATLEPPPLRHRTKPRLARSPAKPATPIGTPLEVWKQLRGDWYRQIRSWLSPEQRKTAERAYGVLWKVRLSRSERSRYGEDVFQECWLACLEGLDDHDVKNRGRKYLARERRCFERFAMLSDAHRRTAKEDKYETGGDAVGWNPLPADWQWGHRRELSPLANLIEQEELDLMMSSLPSTRRTIIEGYLVGEKRGSIARRLGIQPGAVSSAHQKAIQQMRKAMGLDKG